MISAEPWTVGDRGYPLLLQTGETADGRTPLVEALKKIHDPARERLARAR